MTCDEVAKMLGLSGRRVRQAAPQFAEKHGGVWWWDDAAIEKLKSRIGKSGRQRRS